MSESPTADYEARLSTVTLRWTYTGKRAVILLNDERIGTIEFVSTDAADAYLAVIANCSLTDGKAP